MDEKRIYHAPGACNDGWRCGIMEVEVLRTYTWDEYYDKFYDWAESTQVRNIREAMEKPLAEAQMVMEQSMAKYSLKDSSDYIDKKIHF